MQQLERHQPNDLRQVCFMHWAVADNFEKIVTEKKLPKLFIPGDFTKLNEIKEIEHIFRERRYLLHSAGSNLVNSPSGFVLQSCL